MTTLLIIALVVGALIYYVLNLDFEIGTGFSEEKKKAREADYSTKEKEEKKKNILLK